MKLSKLQNISLYLFFFSINFEVWDPLNTDGNFSISKLMGFFYFLSLVPQIKDFVRFKGFFHFLNPLAIFFLLLTVVNFLHLNSSSSDFINLSLFQNIILFILLINHAKRVPGVLQKGMISFGLGSIAIAFLFTIGIGTTYDFGRIRVFGDNENEIGIRMCVSIIYLSFMIIQNPMKLTKKRFLFYLGIPLMLSLLVATGSRVAFISFSLCFIGGLILIRTKANHTKILILGLGLIIGLLIMNYVLSSDILYQRLIDSAKDQDLSDRNIIWKALVPLIESNPLFGVGTSGYSLYSFDTFGRIVSPHNVFIEILCYTGILGLIIYLWFLYRIAAFSWKRYRLNNQLVQLILLIPVLGVILSGQLLTSKIGWVLFAFTIGRTLEDRIVLK